MASPAMAIPELRRFHNFHHYWIRGLLSQDAIWEICLCLLGIVRTRNDDNLGIRYVLSALQVYVSFIDDPDIVLQDAFSSKYKSAVHSGVFENAVKKYRQKIKNQSKKKAKEEAEKELEIPARVRPSGDEELSARAQQSLESLPGKVLEQAKVFHRYIHYLVHGEPEGIVSTDLMSMLDDISRARKLDEKVKEDILQDEDARNVSTRPYFIIP